ncbi:hypothetical protein OFY05_11440 [Pseudocitrobacter faecalis]|nr:hypothetical protein OFY05_11440 [Pseudocitrobacter faecalis]
MNIEVLKIVRDNIEMGSVLSFTEVMIIQQAIDAVMLQAEPVSQPYKLPDNSFTNDDLEMMAHGNNPQANAYRELLAFRRNSPAIPDGWKLVPVEPTLEMIKSGANAASTGMLIPGMYRAMLAAAPQQEAK